MPLLPLRKAASSVSRNGSAATSDFFTKRCAPLATSVTTIAARRAPGLHHGGERHALAGFAPVLGRLQNVLVARQHDVSPSVSVVMPGLGPGIHVWISQQGVDGRDKPSHDEYI